MGSPARRYFLTGASLVLPDRVVSGQTLVIEGDRIAEIRGAAGEIAAGDQRIELGQHLILPGFIDVHVHGVAGTDVLDADGAVAAVARQLPQWGVTAFCPTSIACTPDDLERLLAEVARVRVAPPADAARVLPAHLESNFINPEFRGAQPLHCLRVPAATGTTGSGAAETFSSRDIIEAIDRRRADIAIVTVAPEIDGGIELVRALVAGGVRVSLGHSGATFEQAHEAIAAGARHATHLFNRMRPMTHRDPGLTGAVLASDEIAAELICDGHHVHPAVMRVAIAAKGSSRVMAITDGTAGAGLPPASRTKLGGQPITVSDVARLDDGTLAGSVLTMDRAFASLVTKCNLDLVQAAEMCATTPARELGLARHGVIAPGAVADLTVLNSRLEVAQTWVGGHCIWKA